jgi:tRNA nucleotidyltransferase (CCA-adding enzyme)
MITLPSSLLQLVEHLSSHGIRAIFVGGFVRDHFSGDTTHDLDIELYGVTSLDALERLLSPFGKVGVFGKSFGVLKLSYAGYSIDFSPPRTESKSGFGHKGFEIAWLSELDFTSAARRRDFTINAIGYDPLTKSLLDPYNGIEDLKSKILRCVDPETFVDDPLRILRAIQFAARFELTCDNNLLVLCREMIKNDVLSELPKERIFEEFKKLFLLSSHPSIGMELLRKMGGMNFFSPLDQLETTPQEADSHPEGSVWNHTLMALDTMASMRRGIWRDDMVLMLAMLLHDIGKPNTTITLNGVLNAPKHAEAGVELARKWLEKITEDKELIARILPLVRYHGAPRKLYRTKATDSEILHLSTHVSIADLIMVAKADFFGRSFNDEIPKKFEAGEWLYERASALGVLHSPPQSLLLGRDLIALGLTPSEAFKPILESAYEAQLNQLFCTHEEAILWLKTHLVTEL